MKVGENQYSDTKHESDLQTRVASVVIPAAVARMRVAPVYGVLLTSYSRCNHLRSALHTNKTTEAEAVKGRAQANTRGSESSSPAYHTAYCIIEARRAKPLYSLSARLLSSWR